MAGTINSLGLGSGVLTSSVIDKLKAADKSVIINPIDNKITTNDQQQKAESLLSSLMTSLQTSTSSLSYGNAFDTKTVNVTGSAQVTVDPGANIQSFTLDTTTLAKKDITDFGTFDSKTSALVGSGDSGVLNLSINGTTYGIDYDDTTTLSSLAQSITDKAGTNISASILETGDNKFSLVLSSTTTGANQAITIKDTDDGTNGDGTLDGKFDAYDADNNPNGYQKIQPAADANFKYNGISVTRPTNDISDLVLGVHIKLTQAGDSSNVNISTDKKTIIGEVQQFVDAYNTLSTNINDMTTKNKATGATGVFNGNNFVNSIPDDLNNILLSRSINGQSLMDYGIGLDRHGQMTFNSTALDAKLNSDPTAVKNFFSGGIDANGTVEKGIFVSMNDKLKSYTGYGKLLSNFDDNLKTEGTNLNKSKLSAQDALDAKYAIMTTKFAAYDAMISKINTQSQSLLQIIAAETNTKS